MSVSSGVLNIGVVIIFHIIQYRFCFTCFFLFTVHPSLPPSHPCPFCYTPSLLSFFPSLPLPSKPNLFLPPFNPPQTLPYPPFVVISFNLSFPPSLPIILTPSSLPSFIPSLPNPFLPAIHLSPHPLPLSSIPSSPNPFLFPIHSSPHFLLLPFFISSSPNPFLPAIHPSPHPFLLYPFLPPIHSSPITHPLPPFVISLIQTLFPACPEEPPEAPANATIGGADLPYWVGTNLTLTCEEGLGLEWGGKSIIIECREEGWTEVDPEFDCMPGE